MKYYGAWMVAIVTAISSLWWPMMRDQGVFAWVGDVILRGGLPYLDAFDVKGPLTHYMYALSQAFFGRTQWGIRALDLSFLTVSSYFLWRLAALVCDRRAAYVAVPVFALWYYQGGAWFTAQPDGWAGMLMVMAVWIVVSDTVRQPYSRAAVFGLLIGMCAMLKPLFACFLALWPMYVPTGRPDYKKRAALTLTSVLAFSAVLASVAGWFEFKGALADVVDTLFSFNLTVYSRISEFGLEKAFMQLAHFFAVKPDRLIAAVFAGVGFKAMWSKNRSAFVIIASWAALSMACVIIQNKYFYYHWIPFFAPLSIAAGAGVSRLSETGTTGAHEHLKARMVSRVLVPLFLVVVSIGPLFGIRAWLKPVIGAGTWNEYYDKLGKYGGGDVSFLADREVSEYIAVKTGGRDKVLVWGLEPVIYYMSGRQSPTRYGFVQPLVGDDNNVYQDRNRKRFMQELDENPPAYIVVIDNDATSVTRKTSRQYLDDFPELTFYISRGYVLDKRIEDFEIYRMKGA